MNAKTKKTNTQITQPKHLNSILKMQNHSVFIPEKPTRPLLLPLLEWDQQLIPFIPIQFNSEFPGHQEELSIP